MRITCAADRLIFADGNMITGFTATDDVKDQLRRIVEAWDHEVEAAERETKMRKLAEHESKEISAIALRHDPGTCGYCDDTADQRQPAIW